MSCAQASRSPSVREQCAREARRQERLQVLREARQALSLSDVTESRARTH